MADNNSKKNATANAKPKRSVGRWFKERISELKKVSWPTFPEVMKTLGVVLLVVLAFFIVFFVFDVILGELYKLLIQGIQLGTATESFLPKVFSVFMGLR